MRRTYYERLSDGERYSGKIKGLFLVSILCIYVFDRQKFREGVLLISSEWLLLTNKGSKIRMKVALLNSRTSHSPQPPLGILYIAAVLEKEDYNVKVCDPFVEMIII